MDADGNGRPPTIQDVARSVGLHQSTVSRALNQRAGARVSSETVDRVRASAVALGYVPNPWAVSLRTQSTKLIGVVVPSMRDPIHAALCDAVEQATYRAGYQATFVSSGDTPAGQRRKVEYLLERRVDGLILTDAHRRNPFVADLKTRGIPLVLIIRRTGGLSALAVDELRGGSLVANHLWQGGHRKFGVVGGMAYASTAHDRVCGFLKTIQEFGGVANTDVAVVASEFDVEAGYQACRRLINMGGRVSAIFAVSDLLAVGVMAALREVGRTPGRDVAVVGYNNLPLAARLPIPLSSIHVPLEQLGQLGVARLVRQLEGERHPPEPVLLEPRLIARESSEMVRVATKSASP